MRNLILILLVLLILIAALYYLFGLGGDAEKTALSPTPDASVVEAPSTLPPLEGETAGAPGLVVPSFDVVRVEPDGSTVVAGRAAPGSVVSLLSNGGTVAEVGADARGEFALVLEEPLPPGKAQLSLNAVTPEGASVSSAQTVAVEVPGAGGSAGPRVVLTAPDAASKVLQGPVVAAAAGGTSIRAIDYDDTGNVVISGEAAPGESVEVIVDGNRLGTAEADADGNWSFRPVEQLAPGEYAVSATALSAPAGATSGEAPGTSSASQTASVSFERRAPAAAASGGEGGRIRIERGDSLWTIAQRLYGSGARYTVIYEANAGLIRNPDLIYPGQVFSTPGADPASAGLPNAD